MFQPEQHHCDATALSRECALQQPVSTVTQIVRDGAQLQTSIPCLDHRLGVIVILPVPHAVGVPVRLATSCREDTAEAIAASVTELLAEFHRRNDCGPASVRMAIFTTTPDLRSAKPARAARQAGWAHVPMLCLAEMPTIDDFPRCIRVLVIVERNETSGSARPVYLNGTQALRPDLETD
jgi:chorismate mutase